MQLKLIKNVNNRLCKMENERKIEPRQEIKKPIEIPRLFPFRIEKKPSSKEEGIIQDYKNNMKTEDIEKKYSICSYMMYKILRSKKIPLRYEKKYRPYQKEIPLEINRGKIIIRKNRQSLYENVINDVFEHFKDKEICSSDEIRRCIINKYYKGCRYHTRKHIVNVYLKYLIEENKIRYGGNYQYKLNKIYPRPIERQEVLDDMRERENAFREVYGH